METFQERIKKKKLIRKINTEISEKLQEMGMDCTDIQLFQDDLDAPVKTGSMRLDLDQMNCYFQNGLDEEMKILAQRNTEHLKVISLYVWPEKVAHFVYFKQEEKEVHWYWKSEQTQVKYDEETWFQQVAEQLAKIGYKKEIKKIKVEKAFYPETAMSKLRELFIDANREYVHQRMFFFRLVHTEIDGIIKQAIKRENEEK